MALFGRLGLVAATHDGMHGDGLVDRWIIGASHDLGGGMVNVLFQMVFMLFIC